MEQNRDSAKLSLCHDNNLISNYLGAGATNSPGVSVSLSVAVAGSGGDGARRGSGVRAGDGKAEGGLVSLAVVSLDGEVNSGANDG